METYEMRVVMEIVTNTLSSMPVRKKLAFYNLWESEYQANYGVELYYSNGYALRRNDGNYWMQEFWKVSDYKDFMSPILDDLLKSIYECLLRANKSLKLQNRK